MNGLDSPHAPNYPINDNHITGVASQKMAACEYDVKAAAVIEPPKGFSDVDEEDVAAIAARLSSLMQNIESIRNDGVQNQEQEAESPHPSIHHINGVTTMIACQSDVKEKAAVRKPHVARDRGNAATRIRYSIESIENIQKNVVNQKETNLYERLKAFILSKAITGIRIVEASSGRDEIEVVENIRTLIAENPRAATDIKAAATETGVQDIDELIEKSIKLVRDIETLIAENSELVDRVIDQLERDLIQPLLRDARQTNTECSQLARSYREPVSPAVLAKMYKGKKSISARGNLRWHRAVMALFKKLVDWLATMREQNSALLNRYMCRSVYLERLIETGISQEQAEQLLGVSAVSIADAFVAGLHMQRIVETTCTLYEEQYKIFSDAWTQHKLNEDEENYYESLPFEEKYKPSEQGLNGDCAQIDKEQIDKEIESVYEQIVSTVKQRSQEQRMQDLIEPLLQRVQELERRCFALQSVAVRKNSRESRTSQMMGMVISSSAVNATSKMTDKVGEKAIVRMSDQVSAKAADRTPIIAINMTLSEILHSVHEKSDGSKLLVEASEDVLWKLHARKEFYIKLLEGLSRMQERCSAAIAHYWTYDSCLEEMMKGGFPEFLAKQCMKSAIAGHRRNSLSHLKNNEELNRKLTATRQRRNSEPHLQIKRGLSHKDKLTAFICMREVIGEALGFYGEQAHHYIQLWSVIDEKIRERYEQAPMLKNHEYLMSEAQLNARQIQHAEKQEILKDLYKEIEIRAWVLSFIKDRVKKLQERLLVKEV